MSWIDRRRRQPYVTKKLYCISIYVSEESNESHCKLISSLCALQYEVFFKKFRMAEIEELLITWSVHNYALTFTPQ